MKIAVDLRSLQTSSISGVENYILNLLEHLLHIDSENQYVFFYNSLRSEILEHLQYVNSKTVRTRIPNKFLNPSLKLLGQPKLERLIGDFDLLFLPNSNHFALHPGKKLVVTVHDLSPFLMPEFYNFKRRFWHKFLNTKKIYAQADQLIAVSEHTRHDLIKLLGIPDSKIKVVYPGVDHNFFTPNQPDDSLRLIRNTYHLPGEYFLFISTLEPRKNISGLIKAYERSQVETDLVIAGKLGWKYDKIIQAVKTSKRKRSIHYLGYVGEADKPGLMKLAKAVVYPSFYEGFGFVPLEAMTLGVPVITSQVSAIPEVVRDAALMVNPYSFEDLSFALAEISRNKPLRQKLIDKGLARAAAFSWQKTAQNTLDVFQSLR